MFRQRFERGTSHNEAKVKITLYQATQAQRGLCAIWGWVINFVPTKDIRYRKLVGPRAVLEGYGKSSLHRDLITGPSSM